MNGKGHGSGVDQVGPDGSQGGAIQFRELVARQIEGFQSVESIEGSIADHLDLIEAQIESLEMRCVGKGPVAQQGQLVATQRELLKLFQTCRVTSL